MQCCAKWLPFALGFVAHDIVGQPDTTIIRLVPCLRLCVCVATAVVFVYDFHPGADSLGAKHFKHTKRVCELNVLPFIISNNPF